MSGSNFGTAYESPVNPNMLSKDVEASQYDIGTASIRLVRAGNVLQILFSSSLEARYLYKELAERYKRAQDGLKSAKA